MRGLPTYCEQRGLLVELWFSSPDGDSSDSHILQMCCLTNQQASDLCATWNIIIKNVQEVVVAGTIRPLIRLS